MYSQFRMHSQKNIKLHFLNFALMIKQHLILGTMLENEKVNILIALMI